MEKLTKKQQRSICLFCQLCYTYLFLYYNPAHLLVLISSHGSLTLMSFLTNLSSASSPSLVQPFSSSTCRFGSVASSSNALWPVHSNSAFFRLFIFSDISF